MLASITPQLVLFILFSVSFYILLFFLRAFFLIEDTISGGIYLMVYLLQSRTQAQANSRCPSSVAESSGVKQTPTFLTHLFF